MHRRNVLIASDDAHTRAWLANALQRLDAAIEQGALEDLADRLRRGEVDLVVADGGHDPASLVTIFEQVVRDGSDAALLLVVERDALSRFTLPASWRTDFVVRGGDSAELVARARNLLWPGEESSAAEIVRSHSLTINLATYQAHVGLTPLDLTYLEYALLSFLVTHPSKVYGRETLLQRVWGTDYHGGARTVDVHVRRVRAKLGAELARRLETVRSVGYMWRG